MDQKDLLFFFSYASDDADPHLDKFYEDLEALVRSKSGYLKDDAVGFKFQRDNAAGDQWPDKLVSSLMSARVVVAMYSPSYFGKLYCGRELTVFMRRCKEYEDKHRGSATAILPLVWTPVRKPIPARLSKIHFASTEYGETYAAEGLQYLKSLKRHEDEYVQLLHKFAKRIIDAGEAQTLPALDPAPDITSLDSAFEPLPGESDAPLVQAGPRLVTFVYITASGTGFEWAPYPPPPQETRIGRLSFEIALGLEFEPRRRGLDASFHEYLKTAWQRNEIVVMFVDGNTLHDDNCRRYMLQYDLTPSYINCATLVVWPSELSKDDRDRISRSVAETFRNKGATSNPIYFRSVQTPDELRSAINETLSTLQLNVLGRAEDSTVPNTYRLPSLDATARRGASRG